MGTFTERTLRFLRSNSIALLALFVALGGSAYAASKIGSSDIKRNAVQSRHIDRDAVASRHVRASAIGAEELKRLPFASLRTVSAQTFATNSSTTVEFDAGTSSRGLAVADDGDSIIVERTGVYSLTGSIIWERAGGDRLLEIDRNGTPLTLGAVGPMDRTNAADTVAVNAELRAGDEISLGATQMSGGELTTYEYNGPSASLTAAFLSPAPEPPQP